MNASPSIASRPSSDMSAGANAATQIVLFVPSLKLPFVASAVRSSGLMGYAVPLWGCQQRGAGEGRGTYLKTRETLSLVAHGSAKRPAAAERTSRPEMLP